MATVEIISARRLTGADEVFVHGTVDGEPSRTRVWWSHVRPMTPARRTTYLAQALVDALGPRDSDLGISGTVAVPSEAQP